MNKKILKSIIMIGIIFAIALLLTPTSNAALAITPSKTMVEPGETFNVTVSVSSNEAGAITLSASNGTLSQTSIDLMTEASATVSCVAGNSGTVNLKATGLVANYTTETEATQNASSSVTIQTPTPTPTASAPETTPTVTATPAPATKSSNANLKNLGITPNDFSGFTASKTEYYVTVPYEVETVRVYAKKAESSQTISGEGDKSLEIGATTRCAVTVTAEDGTTQKTYNIYVTRKSEPTETVPNVVEEPEELLKLSTLEVKNAVLSPEFNPDIYEYEISLEDENIEKLDILATANIENASIEVNGNENFMEGENTVTIVLKSEDGTKAATYTIIVTKGAAVTEEEIMPIDEEQEPVEEEKRSIFAFLKSGNTGMIVILVIAVIVLLASIATVVVILVKNKQEENGEMMNFTPNSEYNVFEEKEEDKKEETETEEKPDREKRRGKHF